MHKLRCQRCFNSCVHPSFSNVYTADPLRPVSSSIFQFFPIFLVLSFTRSDRARFLTLHRFFSLASPSLSLVPLLFLGVKLTQSAISKGDTLPTRILYHRLCQMGSTGYSSCWFPSSFEVLRDQQPPSSTTELRRCCTDRLVRQRDPRCCQRRGRLERVCSRITGLPSYW